MKAISGKEFARFWERKGWSLRTIKRSHHVYVTAGGPMHISVPVHGNSPLKRRLLKHPMKIAEITDTEL